MVWSREKLKCYSLVFQLKFWNKCQELLLGTMIQFLSVQHDLYLLVREGFCIYTVLRTFASVCSEQKTISWSVGQKGEGKFPSMPRFNTLLQPNFKGIWPDRDSHKESGTWLYTVRTTSLKSPKSHQDLTGSHPDAWSMCLNSQSHTYGRH